MYKTYKSLDLPGIDKDILAFWIQENIFEKSIEQRSEDNMFVFYEGLPQPTGCLVFIM